MPLPGKFPVRPTGTCLPFNLGCTHVTVYPESNQVRSERNAKIVIVADNKYVRINVSQAASTRAVGEPYPDETNPIGIIYKVLDGGKHGKILSFDEFNGKWGLNSNTGIRSLEDGKSNKIGRAHV